MQKSKMSKSGAILARALVGATRLLPAHARRRAVFERIWAENLWGSAETRSGPGSELARTAGFRQALEGFLTDEQARFLYDAPCGDYQWMKHVNLPPGCRYLGVDIVRPLIDQLRRDHGSERVQFRAGDIVREAPPLADVWLCRESLFHLPLSSALAVVENWRASGVTWFLASTSPSVAHNHDARVGGFRPLNLEIPPFRLGAPTRLLQDAAAADPTKCVGAWRLSSAG
jgi:hypothetical protein